MPEIDVEKYFELEKREDEFCRGRPETDVRCSPNARDIKRRAMLGGALRKRKGTPGQGTVINIVQEFATIKILAILATAGFLLMFIIGISAYGNWLDGVRFYAYGWFLILPLIAHMIPILGIFAIVFWRFPIYEWALTAVSLAPSGAAYTFYWLFVLTGTIIGNCIILPVSIYVFWKATH